MRIITIRLNMRCSSLFLQLSLLQTCYTRSGNVNILSPPCMVRKVSKKSTESEGNYCLSRMLICFSLSDYLINDLSTRGPKSSIDLRTIIHERSTCIHTIFFNK